MRGPNSLYPTYSWNSALLNLYISFEVMHALLLRPSSCKETAYWWAKFWQDGLCKIYGLDASTTHFFEGSQQLKNSTCPCNFLEGWSWWWRESIKFYEVEGLKSTCLGATLCRRVFPRYLNLNAKSIIHYHKFHCYCGMQTHVGSSLHHQPYKITSRMVFQTLSTWLFLSPINSTNLKVYILKYVLWDY